MPAGLDGNPDPVVSDERERVLAHLVDRVGMLGTQRCLVGIDGAPGAGKSTLADELSARLQASGHHVVRATIDSFHRPRAERMQRGPTSPEGYYLDSHQLGVVVGELLEPFSRGSTRVRTAAFDEPTDRPLEVWVDGVPPSAVLVFDGIFLLRPELHHQWSLIVFLIADQRRAAGWDAYLHGDLPADPAERRREIDGRLERARWPRYHDGWQRYLDRVNPVEAADVVIDNDELSRPRRLSSS